MENIIIFDNETRQNLLPFTYTRPICEIRVGILTIREKWEHWLNGQASYITQDYLSEKYDITLADTNYIVNGTVLPSPELYEKIQKMGSNEALLHNGELIVAHLEKDSFERLMNDDELDELTGFDIGDIPLYRINNLWDIFLLNDYAIRADFELLTKGRTSQPISKTNQVLGQNNIFLEEGAKVECAILNATTGPIYIGKNAQVMEGAMLRGPVVVGDKTIVRMGAKIYGATTFGTNCRIGGEINNSVFFDHSNKSHEGFMGNSVIGEWCNIGAGTNNSNLKNNYLEIKLWNYKAERFTLTGQQFCGLFMGDHSKCGINTMFNTGTVIGVSCNIFGEGFPRNFIPSFSWGGAKGYLTFRTDKAFETAENMMKRRAIELGTMERLILLKVFEDTTKFRRWEAK